MASCAPDPVSHRNLSTSDPCAGKSSSQQAAYDKGACFTQTNSANHSNIGEDQAVLENSNQKPELPTPLSDDEVIKLLISDCKGCHSQKDGLYSSFWSLDPASLNIYTLRTDSLAPNIYMALFHRVKNINTHKPSAMPPQALAADQATKYERLLRWFQVNQPLAVQSAVHRFGGNITEHNVTSDFKIAYKCNNLVSGRRFLVRTMQDLFERNPTPEEFKNLLGDQLDAPATQNLREKTVQNIFAHADRLEEFENVGLKKLAYKVSGAHEIGDLNGSLNPEQVEDLRDEFYQYLKKYYRSKSWGDILLQDRVLVTNNTASFYETCEVPAPNQWAECTLQSPRGSFFSTAGFLASKPTSMLIANNNYGRVAMMHYTISGSVFKPATDGPTGDTPKALPNCLNSQDWRGTKTDQLFAPYGTMTIPASGNVCQSCHIGRQLAAGSILFRPFTRAGQIFTNESLETDVDYEVAVAADKIIRRPGPNVAEEAVTKDYLLSLLNMQSEKACISESDASPVGNLTEFAKFLMADGSPLGEGLGRHIPRALSNVPGATEEVIQVISKAYKTEKGLLLPLITSYLVTETFACETAP
jgi:hypothetical protein